MKGPAMTRVARSAALFLLLAAPALAAQAARVDFEVDVTDPASNRVRVAMSLPASPDLRVAMPAWAPGAYRIVKYGQHVRELAASGPDGAPLRVEALDGQTWRIHGAGASPVRVTYQVSAEVSRFDRTHCFLAGPDTYLYVAGRKDLPCRVRFVLPEGWRVGTGLDALEDGTYGARDYDTFIDCPTELGRFETASFEADGARYEVVVRAPGPVDLKALSALCRRIVVEQNRLMGGPPFSRYVFLYHFGLGPGGRGLEHLNSTDIIMPYPAVRADPGLCASITSHEYFHLWNVKRIRPAVLGPFDYTGIVRTRDLWFCEGVTSYFGDLSLARAGIWREDPYLAHLAGEIETLQNNPDRKVTSAEQASWVVWDRKDFPRVDYYNKGELLGLLIDLRLRAATGNRGSLDGVMRRLLREHVTGPAAAGKGPIGTGYPEDGILRAVEAEGGEGWPAFFEKHVAGTLELPYEEILGAAGLSVRLQTAVVADLGADLRGTAVASVPAGGPAEKAGLKAGDRLAAVGGTAVTRSSLREVLAKRQPGDVVEVRVLRGAESLVLPMTLVPRERTTCRLSRAEAPTELQEKILRGWLKPPRDY